jgi:hypothetical protein
VVNRLAVSPLISSDVRVVHTDLAARALRRDAGRIPPRAVTLPCRCHPRYPISLQTHHVEERLPSPSNKMVRHPRSADRKGWARKPEACALRPGAKLAPERAVGIRTRTRLLKDRLSKRRPTRDPEGLKVLEDYTRSFWSAALSRYARAAQRASDHATGGRKKSGG